MKTPILSIQKWEKILTKKVKRNESHKEWERRLIARNVVEAYDKFKKLLNPEIVSRLKSYAKPNVEVLQASSICPYGDLENIRLLWKAKVTSDLFGNNFDTEYEEVQSAYCTMHKLPFINIEDVIEFGSYVKECQELVKIVKSLLGQ